MLSDRSKKITPSAIFTTIKKANQLKETGVDIVSFGAGEPDFNTPQNIKEKAIEAINNNFTKYTAASGIIELKQAIAEKLKKENNVGYSTDEIIVSCGAKQALFNTIFAICNSGDEVIIPAPCWVSYTEIAKLSGAVPIILNTTKETNFKITPEQLQQAITPKTKILIINSPSNPTGSVYTEEELRELAKIIVEKDIFCVSDEVYEKIVYDNTKHVSISSFNPEIKKRTILINAVSKTYAMTGWRIGYAAGPEEIISAMAKIQGHTTSNPTSISQKAALEAINGPQNEVKEMVKQFKKRREFIVSKINSITGLSCLKPQGAFYAWVDISKILGKKYQNQLIDSSVKLAELLITEAHVVTIAGEAFNNQNYIRLSYAVSMNDIERGMENISKFVELLTD